MSAFNMIRDNSGYNSFGLRFSDDKVSTILLNGVEQQFTIPAKFDRALAIFTFEPGAVVWVANNNTATVAGASFAPTNSELNPIAREVKGGDVLHFITTNANADCGVSLYAL